MKHVQERFYTCVEANSYDDQDYTPASGSTLTIRELGGDAGQTSDTVVEVWWDKGGDNDLLFATHGDTIQQNLSVKVEGDGTKVLKIRLKNDTGTDICLGGFFYGIEG